MKKLIIIILTCIVPLMLFLEVWGVFLNQKLSIDIKELEEEQNEWLEENKKLITAIAVYSSPERVEKVVNEELDLKKIDPGNIMKIILVGSKE
ncbi:MAG: cell division protein FtsL [Spirochaetales bacterium]|nr:cell division protein FtsL [Spirochaetales bacterium]